MEERLFLTTRENSSSADSLTLEILSAAYVALDERFSTVYLSVEPVESADLVLDIEQGCTYWELHPDCIGTRIEEELRRAMATRTRACFEYFASGRWFEFDICPASNHALSLYIREVTEQKRTIEALKEDLHRRENFLAVLSHELRNSLGPICTGLDVLKLRAGDSSDVEEIRSIIDHQVHQLMRLIDDMLDISRVNVGKLNLRLVRVDLCRVLQFVVESLRPSFEAAGQSFTFDPPSQPIYVDGDESRLSQIFVNLLTNAVKYTPRGGTIQLSVGSRENEVAVSVTDSGIGVPPEIQGCIFEIFVQGNHKPEANSTGLGIGLTLVKSLVSMHGGRVELQSAGTDCGSTFTVRLPLASALPEVAR